MFDWPIRCWKKIIYSWHIGTSYKYFKLSQEAEKKNNISQAIKNLEKSQNAGAKALDILLDEKFFPNTKEIKETLTKNVEDMQTHSEKLHLLRSRMNYRNN